MNKPVARAIVAITFALAAGDVPEFVEPMS
jgi:hypothetical protein